MKRLFLPIFFVFLSFQQVFALRAFFDYQVFYSPGQGPYVEFVTSFEGSTFIWNAVPEGGFQAAAELTIIASIGDSIAEVRKIVVTGPVMETDQTADFMSLERLLLPAGNYKLEIMVRDINLPDSKADSFTQNIDILPMSEGVNISDISFVSALRKSEGQNAFTKSGYDVIPYVSNYFPSAADVLMFYGEIYNTSKVFGKDAPFVSSVCVMDANASILDECRKIKREKSQEVVPMLQTLDISQLPTGEYKLRIEVRNKENSVVAVKERNFTRSNIQEVAVDNMEVPDEILNSSFAAAYRNQDSLYNILTSHLPISGTLERTTIDYQLKTSDLRTMQSFFYTFWYKRNPSSPESAWREYEKKVAEVQTAFGTRVKPGWKTDRGRVYLQYGAPNTRAMRHNNPDYFPFEIWHYYETNDKLHDRRFLFYDTSLGGDFELLHTDVPNEVKNFDWKTLVRTRPLAVNAADASRKNANQMRDPYSGDELEDLWYNPY